MTDRDTNGRFVKGSVPNPKGRPPKAREERYHEILLTTVTFVDWEKIIAKARDQALKGDSVARKFLADYFIGPPVQRQEHTGADGGKIQIEDDRFDRAISTLSHAIRETIPDPDVREGRSVGPAKQPTMGGIPDES